MGHGQCPFLKHCLPFLRFLPLFVSIHLQEDPHRPLPHFPKRGHVTVGVKAWALGRVTGSPGLSETQGVSTM